MLYAVCTSCSFLRAYSRSGESLPAPSSCPNCGAELLQRSGDGRFPPTYVSRVRRELFGTPELDDAQRSGDAG